MYVVAAMQIAPKHTHKRSIPRVLCPVKKRLVIFRRERKKKVCEPDSRVSIEAAASPADRRPGDAIRRELTHIPSKYHQVSCMDLPMIGNGSISAMEPSTQKVNPGCPLEIIAFFRRARG